MKTYEILFDRLSQTADFVRGQDLADQLGLSRTAIWKAIQTLEAHGIVIESVKNRGYRLVSGDLLLPDKIAAELAFPVHFNLNSHSTQLDAKQGLEMGQAAPSLYLAPNQHQAKGRFGRPFFASSQGGIYMSLHLQPNCSHADLPAYTLMTAASIVKAISRLTGKECQIKWVNDVYLGQKKIAGILTEAITSVETGLVTDLIIGVGLNFYITDFPKELSDKAGSLFNETPSLFRNQLITEIWRVFFKTPEQDLVRYYKDKSLVLDREVSFLDNGQSVKGVATEITDKGELLVQLATGETRHLLSGEVSLSSWEARPGD